ncbi:hypothetical protein JXM83_03840 [Candidatus Woesearchaeota archaeon]|nr:hypothetical protein [Candidatus Woesearchaeota archaeon]
MAEEETKQESNGPKAQENSAKQPDVGSPTTAQSEVKKEKTTRGMTNLILEQIRSLIEINVALNTKVKDVTSKLESSEKNLKMMQEQVTGFDERISKIETNMEKFIGLYEMVTNKYNPFLLGGEQEKFAQNSNDDMFAGIDIEKQKDDAKKILNDLKEKQGVSVDGTVRDELAESLEKAQSSVPKVEFPEENVQKSGENIEKPDLDTFGKVKASEVPPDTEKATEEDLEELSSQFHFVLKDGTLIKSLPELDVVLGSMDDETFNHHVSDSKNDFYEWIKHSMDTSFAEVIKPLKTKKDLKEKISEHIKEIRSKKPEANSDTSKGQAKA